ncbi:hypothetical protein CKO25_02125 [Thiocapsa imhoffii]|uniref:Uncharacterized protein n=1 Tax=Thiocapsa imhoffii TaxID=382777 RepID=A0A9X1B7A7_9GAMM|nr:hypothetical protein [Thiocapsa imhoffii]
MRWRRTGRLGVAKTDRNLLSRPIVLDPHPARIVQVSPSIASIADLPHGRPRSALNEDAVERVRGRS